MTFIYYIIYILSMAPLLHVQIVQKGGRLCLAEVVAAPIMQTLSQGQSDQGVSENCSGKPDMSEWTLAAKKILCQQPSIRLSGNSHPPAGFIQGLISFGLRLGWHLLASIVALKERLEQS